MHDDRVQRQFTATAPNRLWLAGVTEHRTTEGKLYLCAVKDVFSGRNWGLFHQRSHDRQLRGDV